MAKNLLIVESPAKAKTINRYLGKDFEVLASYGHIRDLPSRDGAVDTENDFSMHYELSEGSKKHVDKIVKATRSAEAVYLATDLDREGEAISWHIYEILKGKKLADKTKFYRVEFSEITKRAIQEAVANPRELSMDLVNAQQARRALDHLVGFNLSPLLWKKIKPGLSAGRVQSPALRMIVEREREIERFKAEEYWTIEADLHKNGHAFTATLSGWTVTSIASSTSRMKNGHLPCVTSCWQTQAGNLKRTESPAKNVNGDRRPPLLPQPCNRMHPAN